MYYGSSPLSTILSTVVTPATPPTGAAQSASPYDLTTVEDAAFELQLTSSNDLDKWLQRVITACSLGIAQYCNRVFPLQTYQDTFFLQRDPFPGVIIGGAAPLQLKYEALAAGSSSVTENGVALVLGTDYLEDPGLSQLTRLDMRGFPMRWPKFEIAVQYQAGYAADSDEMTILADACLQFVKFRYFSRLRDPGIKSENVVGVYEASYLWGTGPGGPNDIPADIAGKIDRFRVPVVA